MSEAEQAFQAALQIDSKSVAAYVGLAGLYQSFSLYAHAYAALKRAHGLDPKKYRGSIDVAADAATSGAFASHPGVPGGIAGSHGRYRIASRNMPTIFRRPAMTLPIVARSSTKWTMRISS